jgi:hypothetical protein
VLEHQRAHRLEVVVDAGERLKVGDGDDRMSHAGEGERRW